MPSEYLRGSTVEPVERKQLVVRKLKFDGSVRYEWDGDLVEERDGWLVVLHDWHRHEKRQTASADGNGEKGYGIHYLGTDGPLSVLFWFDVWGEFGDAKCDAALPAVRKGKRADFVDLDLDVVVLPGGTHYIRDQEVFADRSISMRYSEEAKKAAHLGILHALRKVRRGTFPFDGHAEKLMKGILSGTPARK